MRNQAAFNCNGRTGLGFPGFAERTRRVAPAARSMLGMLDRSATLSALPSRLSSPPVVTDRFSVLSEDHVKEILIRILHEGANSSVPFG